MFCIVDQRRHIVTDHEPSASAEYKLNFLSALAEAVLGILLLYTAV